MTLLLFVTHGVVSDFAVHVVSILSVVDLVPLVRMIGLRLLCASPPSLELSTFPF